MSRFGVKAFKKIFRVVYLWYISASIGFKVYISLLKNFRFKLAAFYFVLRMKLFVLNFQHLCSKPESANLQIPTTFIMELYLGISSQSQNFFLCYINADLFSVSAIIIFQRRYRRIGLQLHSQHFRFSMIPIFCTKFPICVEQFLLRNIPSI